MVEEGALSVEGWRGVALFLSFLKSLDAKDKSTFPLAIPDPGNRGSFKNVGSTPHRTYSPYCGDTFLFLV